MNTLKKIAITLLAIPLMHSCYNLKSEVYDTINPDMFPKTAKDAESLVAASYWPLRWQMLGNNFTRALMTLDLCTDVGSTNDRQGSWVGWENLTWTATGNGGLANSPNNTYIFYKDISMMTLNIDRIEGIDMDPVLKARYIAEIKCARAWLSYFLFDIFGPIPVAPLEVLKDPINDIQVERLTNEAMVKFIEDDCIAASSVLPYSYTTSADKGRFTKGMANMLLLKLYMHEKQWAKAETAGRELMKSEYKYGLISNYRDIFTLENEGNKEIIYAINCTVDYGQMLMNYYLPSNFPLNNPSITQLNAFRSPWAFYHSFEAGDKRKELLIGEYVGIDGLTWNEQNVGNFLGGGVVPHKYGEDPQSIGFGSQVDYIVFRYADAITLLAEAIANKDGAPTQEAMDLVNMIRNRAGLANKNLSDYGSLEKFNALVLAERGYELWWESVRRTDLIRHGKFIEYATKRNPALATQQYRVLFPIPEAYITEGQGKIKQNDGY